MKKDLPKIREILFDLEDASDVLSTCEKFDDENSRYQKYLLIKQGLVEGSINNSVSNLSQAPSDVSIRTLTPQGHDFVANIRNDEVWNTIIREFSSQSLSAIGMVAKELTIGYLKGQLKKRIGAAPELETDSAD